MTTDLLSVGSTHLPSREVKEACKDLLAILRERHPTIVDAAYFGATDVDHYLIERPSGEMVFVKAYAADLTSRIDGVRAMIQIISAGQGEENMQDVESAIEALTLRLMDNDEAVTTIHDDPGVLYLALGKGDRLIDAMISAFDCPNPNRNILRLHLRYLSDEIYPAPDGFERKVFERLLYSCLVPTSLRKPFGREEWNIIMNGRLGRLDILKTLKIEIDKFEDRSGKHQIQVMVQSLAGKSLPQS